MSAQLAKLDTALIRNTLTYTRGRPYSESRAYGRRIKFWMGPKPLNGDIAKCTELLKNAFGERFIKCSQLSTYEFEVQLKAFTQ